MSYLLEISNSLLKWGNSNPNSRPIILSAVRDFLIYEEAQALRTTMVKTAANEQPTGVSDLINSLRETDRDLRDILKSIDYIQTRFNDQKPSPKDQQEITKTAMSRLGQLHYEAANIGDGVLSREIAKLINAAL
jgi:hypothetical protein